mmetsp:Transcript_3762/g.14280  ORF Transcript_3762/g.14280 Transcript_3762/m.14280 type:complete len:92 (-) Transcript_3762:4494-4769(-)
MCASHCYLQCTVYNPKYCDLNPGQNVAPMTMIAMYFCNLLCLFQADGRILCIGGRVVDASAGLALVELKRTWWCDLMTDGRNMEVGGWKWC